MFGTSHTRWPILLLACAVLAGTPSSQPAAATTETPAERVCPPAEATRNSFAVLYQKALRRAGHFEDLFYEEREFRLRST
jgi:hypothetical protein